MAPVTLTIEEAARILARVAECGQFVAANCPTCKAPKRPLRDIARDGEPCATCGK